MVDTAAMKLYSLYIFRKPSASRPKPALLASFIDMSAWSFWQRGTVKEITLFVSREIVSRLPEGSLWQSCFVAHSFC